MKEKEKERKKERERERERERKREREPLTFLFCKQVVKCITFIFDNFSTS